MAHDGPLLRIAGVERRGDDGGGAVNDLVAANHLAGRRGLAGEHGAEDEFEGHLVRGNQSSVERRTSVEGGLGGGVAANFA